MFWLSSVKCWCPQFGSLSTWGFHSAPLTLCPILATSCSSFFPQHCNWPRSVRTTRKRSQFKSSQMENMENRSAGHHHIPLPHPSSFPLLSSYSSLFSFFFFGMQQAATVWLTNWLFRRSPCPFQSEFIEGDFDLLHEATAVAMPSVTLIAWWTLGGLCYGSWSFTDCAAFASIRTTCTEPDGEHARLLWVFISMQEGAQPLGLPEELLSSRRPCCSSTNTVFFSCH